MELEIALGEFLVQLEADGRSHHSRDQYRRHIGLLSRYLDKKDLDEIRHTDLAGFLASDVVRLRADGEPRKASSANTIRSSIRTFFGFVYAAGYTKVNAARLIRRARTGTAPPRALSEADQGRLLDVLAGAEGRAARRDHALFYLILATGLRLGSALALRVEDLDLDAGEIEVRVAKGDRPGRVFATPKLVEHLRGYVAEVGEGYLFPGQSGGPLNPRQAARRLAGWVERAGIRRSASPHTLRHSFARGLLERSGDLILVQRALHHASVTSTARYLTASDERLRAAMGA